MQPQIPEKTDCALSVYPSYTGVPATRLVLLRAAGTAAGRMGPCPQEADLLVGEKGQSGRGHLIGTRPKPRQWGVEMEVPGGHSIHRMGLGRGEACRLKAGVPGLTVELIVMSSSERGLQEEDGVFRAVEE